MADKTYQFEVELDNGATLNAGEFTVPQGEKGDTGATPDISVTATVDNSTGIPAVTVEKGGSNESPTFEFQFKNMKGEQGDPGTNGNNGVTPSITATATVGATVGTPSVEVVKGGTDAKPTFAFNFSNLKGQTGAKGDTGNPGAKGDQGVGIKSVKITEVV